MAKQHFLRFIVSDEPEDLIFEVRQTESDRLHEQLTALDRVDGFFWFDTVDGRAVIINLARIQAVRFLWEVGRAPSDSTRSGEDIQIKLARKPPVIEDYTEDPDSIFYLFYDLEEGSKTWVSFVDQDGEAMLLASAEVVWITAPTHVLQEGRVIAERK